MGIAGKTHTRRFVLVLWSSDFHGCTPLHSARLSVVSTVQVDVLASSCAVSSAQNRLRMKVLRLCQACHKRLQGVPGCRQNINWDQRFHSRAAASAVAELGLSSTLATAVGTPMASATCLVTGPQSTLVSVGIGCLHRFLFPAARAVHCSATGRPRRTRSFLRGSP